MKFLHTADWHMGKKIFGYDLLEEQQFAFQGLMTIAKREKVDAIILAGDIYDRGVPATTAVTAFQKMMYTMNIEEGIPVLTISGNHDSSVRLETGAPWLRERAFYIHTQLKQAFEPIELNGIQFYLLPYFEPFEARSYFADESLNTVSLAMQRIVAEMQQTFDSKKQQVLIAHFFAAGSLRGDSETPLEVGGLDAVPLDLLADFDYVALGHLHNKNAIKAGRIQYSGALLKYALDELKHEKGVRIIELSSDVIKNKFVEIPPLHDIIELKASFAELIDPQFYQKIERENFISIRLTDTQVIPHVMNQLRQIYPRIIHLERASGRVQFTKEAASKEKLARLKPDELFSEYFQMTTGKEMSEQQQKWLSESLLDAEMEGR